ncbi:hypothetical protein HDU91_007054 [Kappamyces sp. JEL0680]|nr:hypothetical protein HDU91_007054 [Kappamyces sp. JEL0680]
MASNLTVEELFEQESRAHAEKERLLNLDIDAEINKYIDNPVLGFQLTYPFFTRPSNPSLFFIVPNEFAERFCYYGITPLMKNLFGKVMGLDKYTISDDGLTKKDSSTAVAYKSMFTSYTYVTPIIGSLISDSYLDKFKTIVSFSTLYMIGNYLLFISTNPGILGYQNIVYPNGVLSEAAASAGGIKPCVSAHGGDQFLPSQQYALQLFYNIFYVAVNVGAVISSTVSPIVKDGTCFGVEKACYSYAFLMCAILFTFALAVFVSGKRFYRVVPPAGRFIFFDILKAGVTSLVKGKEYATSTYGPSLVTEAGDLGLVMVCLIPACLFNVAYEQLGNSWQDTTDRMAPSFLTSEQVQNLVNPAFIFFLAPLLATQLYPRIPRFTLLWRMVTGFVFMALASMSAAWIDNYVSSGCVFDEDLGICVNLNVSNLLFIVPVFLITVGEVLINISGLNFTYIEVGKRTKSFSSALWLVTSSIGAQISAQVVLASGYSKTITNATYYYYMAGFAAAGAVLQLLVAYYYVPKAVRDKLNNNVNHAEAVAAAHKESESKSLE